MLETKAPTRKAPVIPRRKTPPLPCTLPPIVGKRKKISKTQDVLLNQLANEDYALENISPILEPPMRAVELNARCSKNPPILPTLLPSITGKREGKETNEI